MRSPRESIPVCPVIVSLVTSNWLHFIFSWLLESNICLLSRVPIPSGLKFLINLWIQRSTWHCLKNIYIYKLKRLGGLQISHQILLKFLHMMYFPINYYLVKKKSIYFLPFDFWHFLYSNTELSFERRSLQSKNGHVHRALLIKC